ncbi:MAG: glycoside hydrolase N-terminal domain-containing protein [Oscillospiraceae bacterium]|nr:glycoside hydrolase N-terminal domain-containing protein [Oscillospiraceae bacterium]
MKEMKKFISAASALCLSANLIPSITAGADAAAQFDPETVMWTDRTIEEVLAETGKYQTVQDVDPNAAKSADPLNIQSPYAKPGETYQSWDYSEFVWTNFYPIGNGRMAGMVAGGINNEVIQINEDTCWDGSPYGTLVDEQGNVIDTMKKAYEVSGKILTKDQTGGSDAESWRYFRGADENDDPAEIGAADVVVGDETFRTKYPEFANKSIANQALNIDNSANNEAVQKRWSMEKMVEETFLGTPTKQRAYKSFVEVFLNFNHDSAKASNYTKSLDMNTGVVTVEYDLDGNHYKRESFASYPDQVVVTHLESNADLDFSAQLHTYHMTNGYYSYEKISDKEVKLRAAVTNGNKDRNIAQINVINFEARMLLDGEGAFSVSSDNSTVTVKGGKSANIYVVGATNYVDYLTLDNAKPARDCEYYMNNVKSKTYEQIKSRHLADFTEQFSKTELSLSNTGGKDYSKTPTEERVRKPINGKSGFLTGASSKTSDANKAGVYTTYSEGDNQLAALEFNYGKYLIISGSRDGRAASGSGEIDIPESQPLNLTGKWNAAFSASWNGKYTININTEMNYWAAQPLNIGDSERPFIDTFDELAQSGSITAAYQYGIYNERGDDTYQPGDPWVMHHNYDLWRGTQPIDNATAGLWPTGGAWLLDHAWQYYLYNRDKEYLAEIYPYMVGAAKFFTQFLVIDPVTGYLVTAASCSPEQGGVQPGPAMDTQLVRNLYDMVRQSSEILGKTEENADLLSKIDAQMPSDYLGDEQGKIAPNLIDSAGLIKEWARGDVSFDISKRDSGQWTVTNPFTGETINVYDHGASNTTNHRHCSHLWEIFPGTHLSGYSEDENEQKIFKAYQKSVSARSTGSGQGWGLAWRIGLNARALDGNAASTMLEQLFTTRTSPNLFDQHPNFQIDGNYGATAGMIEMLIQSHDGAITLLPALPEQWKDGSFKGFKTREGATVDLSWNDAKPTEAKIHATETKDISVRSKYMSEVTITDENGNAVEVTLNTDRNLATFAVEAGKTYTITNFGTNIVEGDKVYKATDVTEFYASDNGSAPKADGDGYSIGYIYNRNGVKIGYAVEDFDFDGLKALMLNMKSVRYDNTYVSIHVDSPAGTEIVNQIITTGNNELDLKNISGINGTHKIYVLYVQDPYDGDSGHKYLGNAADLTATYSKTVETPTVTPTAPPTDAPTEPPATDVPTAVPTDAPSEYDYVIKSAYFENDSILKISLNGSDIPAKLIIASYDADGKLTSISIKDVNGDAELSEEFAKPETGTVKIFVWDGLDTMKPLSVVVFTD